MYSHKLLLDDISRDHVDHFDECDNANPYIEPSRDIQNWNQLEETNENKNEIRNRVQFRAKLADSVRYSGDPTIGNISKSGCEV